MTEPKCSVKVRVHKSDAQVSNTGWSIFLMRKGRKFPVFFPHANMQVDGDYIILSLPLRMVRRHGMQELVVP